MRERVSVSESAGRGVNSAPAFARYDARMMRARKKRKRECREKREKEKRVDIIFSFSSSYYFIIYFHCLIITYYFTFIAFFHFLILPSRLYFSSFGHIYFLRFIGHISFIVFYFLFSHGLLTILFLIFRLTLFHIFLHIVGGHQSTIPTINNNNKYCQMGIPPTMSHNNNNTNNFK